MLEIYWRRQKHKKQKNASAKYNLQTNHNLNFKDSKMLFDIQKQFRKIVESISEAPLIRGMPTGSETFFKPLGVPGLRPSTRNHLKKTLCRTCSVGGTYNKYL